jgi:hypothetical protein
VPHPKGAILTDRDRALLSYVGIARYASAEQLHRLFFDGHSPKQTYRRLAKLCLPGSRPGEAAYLRRLEFRRREGTGVPVWALTPYGRTVVLPLVSWLRPPAEHDVGARFLEHTLVLNDVLVGLVQKLRPSAAAPMAALPFRWLCEDDEVLQYQRHDIREGRTFASVLKPDAILEIPGRGRRLFLEAETGTQSITTAHPGRNGAIVSKLQRYATYFEHFGADVKRTWYEHAFHDRFAARLVFLVHSSERKDRVQLAVDEYLRSERPARYKVLVYTFAEAAGVLAPYITNGVLPQPGPQASSRVVTIEAKQVQDLKDGYNELVEAFNAVLASVKAHNATAGAAQVPLPRFRAGVVAPLVAFLKEQLDLSIPVAGAVPTRTRQ